ncbi:MAG TPA: hypothetical protein VKU02_18410 [Gemmataceae bacterium]|nr:hypothetical protein [Gemmataceae bacterium]
MQKRALASAIALLMVFGLSGALARAEDQADQILRASHDYVSSHSVEIQQTIEQTMHLVTDGKPAGSPQTTKQTSVLEIDAGKGIMRLTTRGQDGKDLVVIRKGDRVAMKIGSGPWTVPTGPYAQMREQMANPFACPLPKSTEKDSPRWKIVGQESFDGQETTVLETVGDTANAYALQRMREGIASMFTDPKVRPTIEVLAYKSRHWIGKDSQRRLRVEQTSHQKLTMPAAGQAVIDSTSKTTALYRRYDRIVIDVPEEARRILEAS